MKMKIALLLLATLGSAALVAPAQQAPPRTSFVPDGGTQSVIAAPAPPPVYMVNPAEPQALQRAGRSSVRWYTVTTDLGPRTKEAQTLAETYAHESSESARETIRKQLTTILVEQFDERQKRHQEEVKQLEDQVKKLKDLIDRRQENRQEIVTRRLDQMLREAQGLGW